MWGDHLVNKIQGYKVTYNMYRSDTVPENDITGPDILLERPGECLLSRIQETY
jgi:hypothetical protein